MSIENSTINLYKFYYLKNIEKLGVEDIMQAFNISRPTYAKYASLIKTLDFSINTNFLEKELMLQYNICEDSQQKIKILESMMKIWEKKDKVKKTEETDAQTIDFTSLTSPIV
jgi:hypothetical protein